jgi:Kef-type K+ transport system membrane component KefB
MLFAVKPIGELFHRIRRQIVLGELLAGIIMVAATTIITLIWLKMAYRKDPSEPATIVQKEET